jgi:PAS domain S-box-containing protein
VARDDDTSARLRDAEDRIARLEAERDDLRARLADGELLRDRNEIQQERLLQCQRELEASHDRYTDLYDFAPLPYVTLDQNGLLKEANLTAVSLLGYSREHLLGRALRSFATREDSRAVLEHLRRCRSGESPVRTELRIVGAHGKVIPFEVVSRPIRKNVSLELRTVFFELTERLAGESERQRLQQETIALEIRSEALRAAGEAKDRFLAMLSHELRTPLTPIVGTLDVLERQPALPADLTSAFALIRRNVEAEVRLVDELLDVSRVSEGKLDLRPESLELHALAAEVVEDALAQARLKRLELRTQLEASRSRVQADPYRIRQVIRNLLNNAIKFSPPGGIIVVRTDNPRTDWVRLEITDDGIGLTRDQLERVFLPFEQAETHPEVRQGLGLGLTISKGIVEAHNGTIHAYSAGPGRGARFAFELENSPWLPAPTTRRRPTSGAARARHVLLVEDHADSAEALCILLESEGYRVHVATSIADAVARAEGECDVLVSDLQLPDGSGHALLQRLPRPLPAIAVSGHGAPEDVKRSREAGFVDHLVKPVSGDRLLEAIERALGRIN